MEDRNPKSIQEALRHRRETQALRRLVPVCGGVDLCSNDYLGLSRKLAELNLALESKHGMMGATGSRLVSGTTQAHEDLEDFLSQFVGQFLVTRFGGQIFSPHSATGAA
jgi:8-amino-7-oxononanoate synthase